MTDFEQPKRLRGPDSIGTHMSYDIGVWHASRPITTQEAVDIFSRLGEANLRDAEPHPGVEAFLKELTLRYPQIDDWAEKDIDACPWSVAFDYSDCHVLMCLSYSRVNEVVPFVKELAAKHDLVCFNPQWPCVEYPPRIGEMPHLRLFLENWTVIDNPTPQQISVALSSLNSDGNSFAILERTNSAYMQTGLQSSGEYVIEYQDGSLDMHYQAIDFDIQHVTSIFQAYGAGNEAWKHQADWKRIEL
ncbi:MAG: hypothetical protein KDB03_14845 [Planctomycetales bacterium]|nr:hypothetical protein [Planctomycetales bacterium]